MTITASAQAKKTVSVSLSLPANLAHTIEQLAENDGKTLDKFIVDALWQLRAERARNDLAKIHEGWHLRMMRLGLFSEADLWRYLES